VLGEAVVYKDEDREKLLQQHPNVKEWGKPIWEGPRALIDLKGCGTRAITQRPWYWGNRADKLKLGKPGEGLVMSG